MATQASAALSPNRLKKESSIFNQPLPVWVVFFASVFAFMGMGLVNPILRELSEKLHASPSEVSLLFTSYNAVMACAMLLTAKVSSKLGIKGTLMAGVCIIAIVSFFGGHAGSIWTLVGLRAGWGLGNALFVATALTAFVSLSSSGSAKAIILYEAAAGIGMSIGPLLGGTLGSISWKMPFFVVSSLMLITCIGLAVSMPRAKVKNAAASAGAGADASFSTGAGPNAGTKPKPKASLLDPFRALKQHHSLLVLGIVAALYNIGFFTIMAFAPFVMGLKPRGMGYVFLGWGILLAITSVFIAPILQKKFGTLKSLVCMLFLFVVDLAIMGMFTSTREVVIVAVIIAGAIIGNSNTLITTAVMNAAPVERSTASAAYSFLRFLGAAISPYMAGKLSEIFNAHVPFIVGAAFVLLSIVYMWANSKHIRHIDRAPASH
ncbi:MFS transporter [Paenibacillus sp. NEAU-GSW1]|uniref:MFS transporter n=1 Tax=Paenibacillus sp. NEAU-GSW1 TaxID=2682486 RepID=UPI0012E161D7|nr:MFS transporter [Paenibacillus sp. NEAU-GSW1]MUT66471.1 MFS transporter [Paenibacillus sp. NEAU-GSW1]